MRSPTPARPKATPATTASAACPDCHQKLWDGAKDDKAAQAAKPRLGVVASNIASYKESFHARPRKNDKDHAIAACDDCHDTHTFNVPPKDSPSESVRTMRKRTSSPAATPTSPTATR